MTPLVFWSMFTLFLKHLNTRVKLIKKLIKIWFLKDLLLIFNLQMYKFCFYFDRILNYLWICFFSWSDFICVHHQTFPFTFMSHSSDEQFFGDTDPCFLWHQFYSIANWKKTALDLDHAWCLRSNSLAFYYFCPQISFQSWYHVLFDSLYYFIFTFSSTIHKHFSIH